MEKTKNIMESEMENIIKGFRQNSIEVEINQEHIHKWVSQFSLDTQDIILKETLHILKKWYFGKDKINSFLDDMIDYLKSENKNAIEEDPLKDIVFLNIQVKGKSQSQLIEMLDDRVREKYGCNIKTEKTGNEKYYVYLDDGLYTGSTLRKDMRQCIATLPEGARIDVFYIIACKNGYDFSKRELKKMCEGQNTKINICMWKMICNDKKIIRKDNGFLYDQDQECLWPSSELKIIPEINAYAEKLQNLKGKEKLYYCFRNAQWQYTAGIFTNLKNRNIVEEEFLKKGIAILENNNDHKGIYPLGYSLTPSLGFGSFCATDLNISNTCPVVLWWGNVVKKGNQLDAWYPLLPRRVNVQENNLYEDNWMQEEAEMDECDGVFTTCPDCGCGISLSNDGGNGFCSACAWKH